MLGCTVDEMLGKSVLSFILEEDLADKQVNFMQRFEGKPGSYERRFRVKDGITRTFNVSATPFTGDDGSTRGSFAMLTDITERKDAEIALQKAHDNLEVQVEERTADLYSANMKLQKEIDYSNVIAGSLKEYAKMTSILNEVIITANKAETLPNLFRESLDRALELLDFEAGGIYLVNPEERTAEVHYNKNLPDDFIEKTRTIPIDAPPYETLFTSGQPIVTEHFDEFSPELAEKSKILSLASIPLVSKNIVIGALNVASKKRYTLSANEIQVLTVIGRELGTTIARMIAEEEVKTVSVNLQTLFASINEMVFVLDMEGRIISVNDSVVKRLQYTQEELTGMNVLLLHVPERRDEALRNVQGMIAGTVDSCPVPLLSKDGTRTEAETKVTRGWWNGQKVLIGVTRDVTERKQMEEALLQLTDRLLLATRAGGVGIWDYDVVNNILTWDDQMFALYGITRQQFGGAYDAWQAGVHPEDRQRGDAEIQMALGGEKEFDTEFHVLWPDGSIKTIRALALVQRDDKGKPLRMIGTNWDITLKKNTEE
jgi:PAS domain S-box-containing protein